MVDRPSEGLALIPLPLLLERNARLFRNKAALMRWTEKGWARYTYAMLFTAVRRLAVFLKSAGLAPGERVGIAGVNSPEWMICFLGAQAAGGVAVPLAAEGPDTVEAARGAQPRLLFADESLCGGFEQALPLDRIYSFQLSSRYDSLAAIARRVVESAQEPVDLDAPAAMLPTGAGRREGVALTHRALIERVNRSFATGRYRSRDCFFSVLPLSDPIELVIGNLLPLCIGATTVYAGSLEPDKLFPEARAVHPTVMLVDRTWWDGFVGWLREGRAGVPVCEPADAGIRGTSARLLNRVQGGLGGRACYARARKVMGLDALRFFVCTEGPPGREVQDALSYLGFPLVETPDNPLP